MQTLGKGSLLTWDKSQQDLKLCSIAEPKGFIGESISGCFIAAAFHFLFWQE